MRAYAYIVPTFWSRGSGKKLRGNPIAQTLALYLLSAPSSNMIGLYYLPLATVCAETGLTTEQVKGALSAITEIAKYDTEAEVVWIPEAAAHQIGETLKSNDNKRKAVIRELAMAGDHAFVTEFMTRYGNAYALPSKGVKQPTEAPSKGVEGVATGASKPPSPAPDPVPVSRVSEPGVKVHDPDAPKPVRFPMSLDWRPTAETMRGFDIAMIPRPSAEALVSKAIQHFCADKTRLATDAQWNQSIIRWVNTDWADPKKRPKLDTPQESTNGYGKKEDWL